MKYPPILALGFFLISTAALAQSPTESGNMFDLLDQAPEPLNLSEVTGKIVYPSRAIEEGLEGLVQVMVQVDRFGNYVDHKVARSSHPLLTDAVEVFLPCLIFSPGIQGETAVSAWKAIPFRFSLKPMGMNKRKDSLIQEICPKGRTAQPRVIVSE